MNHDFQKYHHITTHNITAFNVCTLQTNQLVGWRLSTNVGFLVCVLNDDDGIYRCKSASRLSLLTELTRFERSVACEGENNPKENTSPLVHF